MARVPVVPVVQPVVDAHNSAIDPAPVQSSTINPDQESGFILLIAPNRSYRVASYINAAHQLGYQLLIVSDSKHSLVAEIASGITVDFTDSDQAFARVMDSIAGQVILSVIATDDSVVTLSSRIARTLGLPHNDPEAALLTVRKDLARKRLQQHNCNVPEFTVCSFVDVRQQAARLPYPVVVKPLMLSASRGVIRADNEQEFIAAAARLKAIVDKEPGSDYEHVHFLVEEFLAGDEIALDGFIQDGQLIPLALFDKPEPMNGPFFEESYYITPSRHSNATQREILREIERCCKAYGLHHGPIHAEARITERGVVLLEMAATRPRARTAPRGPSAANVPGSLNMHSDAIWNR